ncbi:MAG: AraC family transcriptional regulator, partial [Oscillospiraceae bacterium]|nr:AraC family transcriptional regulator [Oscillospiraceae bacterium]
LEYAFSLINETTYPISEISRMSGYNDPLYFGKVFKNKYGVSPSYVNTLML